MKKEEIKEMTTADLKDRLEVMQKDYLMAKAQHAVSPLDNPARLTADRRMIARVKTELRMRQIKEEAAK